LFVLPSLQENFGMAAAEALAGGVPAITTTEAPWSRLPEANAGWCVAPTVEGLTRAVAEAIARESPELCRMGLNAHRLMTCSYSWSAVATRFMETYREIAGQNSMKHAETTLSHEPALRRRVEAIASS
ncbi:MAG: glycosyltransferase, partial [Rhodomicrobium sp.]